MTFATAVCLLILLSCVGWAGQPTFTVAPHGDDSNPGTQARPFATIHRARDAVRALDKSAAEGPVIVEIAAGTYELDGPVEFTAADSGTAACPVEYRARKGQEVRIVGGRIVGGWRLVTDPAALKRLPTGARGKVFQTDLKALGITDLEGINRAGVYQSDPGLELFFRDTPMTLSRYPNDGYMHIAEVYNAEGVTGAGSANTPEGRFICDDPRPKRWADEKDIWLHGFWVWDWADERIPLGSIDLATNTLSLGPRVGRSFNLRRGQWFYAENVMPELDSPGEWYVDRESSILYFCPPAPLSSGKTVVSVVRDLFQLNDASNITFRGLLMESGRGSAVVVRGGENVRVVACTIRNMGNWAVKAYGGLRHGVVGCDVYGNGQGGIHLEG